MASTCRLINSTLTSGWPPPPPNAPGRPAPAPDDDDEPYFEKLSIEAGVRCVRPWHVHKCNFSS